MEVPIYTFSLLGNIPSKKNSRKNIWKRGRVYNIPSKAYTTWENQKLIAMQKNKIPVFDFPIKLDITVYYNDGIRRDLDNRLNSILDLMVKSGMIKDDNYFIVQSISIKAIRDNYSKTVIQIYKI